MLLMPRRKKVQTPVFPTRSFQVPVKVVILIIKINIRDIILIILLQYFLYFICACTIIIIFYFLYYLFYLMMILLQKL